MKVLDLQCTNQHIFEGWFATEAEFISQHTGGLVTCPVCADVHITKRLSAPRLLLSPSREKAEISTDVVEPSLELQKLTAAWMHMARQVVANTTDVGEHFAEEARKMHYGESEERAIRGKATPQEAHALVEEGIAVVPLLLPEVVKEPLH